MKRPTRPFSVETKPARKPPRSVGLISPRSTEDRDDPFPDDVPVRDVHEDVLAHGTSEALQEAERVFAKLSTPPHPTAAYSPHDADPSAVELQPVKGSGPEVGGPRILPDLFAQARDEEQQATTHSVQPQQEQHSTAKRKPKRQGAVSGVVGIEVGVVSGVLSPDESGGDAPDLWRPRHAKRYHEA
jgi:hypothetical protein